MDDIDSSAWPFPYRVGNIFDIQYNVLWNNHEEEHPYIKWMQELYDYMASHVSSSRRVVYVNYLDLDLGSAKNGTTTLKDTIDEWGILKEKYQDTLPPSGTTRPGTFLSIYSANTHYYNNKDLIKIKIKSKS